MKNLLFTYLVIVFSFINLGPSKNLDPEVDSDNFVLDDSVSKINPVHEVFCTLLPKLKTQDSVINIRPMSVWPKLKKVSTSLGIPSTTIFTPNHLWTWNRNQKVKVYFYLGDKPVHDRIIKVANEWSKYCSVSFDLSDFEWDSQVRVDFKGDKYSSVVGTECLDNKYKLAPTMYLGGLDTMQNMVEFKRIVLHEFGHALGLEHEMKNPDAQIPWDTTAVYDYCKEHYGWNPEEVKTNVFNRLEKIKGKHNFGFDQNSIMIYGIPKLFTGGKLEIKWPTDLSAIDKLGINKWYPKK